MRRQLRESCTLLFLTALLSMSLTREASAEGFIAPFIGYNFGGDSGCPTATDCEDKKLNAGLALGTLGTLFGFEEEFGYARNFFGDAPGRTSSVFTLMSNVMITPNIGPIRPYALAGLGLMKSRVNLSQSSLLSADNNDLGWDVGGGLMGFFGSHVGVRGDLRYFHAFKDLRVVGFTLGNTKLDFGRASLALVLKF